MVQQNTDFQPKLHILPASQLILWQELDKLPTEFVLYGGTAVALHLGHRQSIDFDFFTTNSFNPTDTIKRIPFLRNSSIVQQSENTLTCVITRGDPIKVSFFGLPELKAVQRPVIAAENNLKIASTLDLLATKLLSIQQRSEAKDYIDIDALINARVPLEEGISAAKIVFGDKFNPLLSLKALVYFGDGDLASLDAALKERLIHCTAKINL